MAPISAPAAAYPSRNAWLALALFVLSVLLAYVDRQILAVLVEPIRASLRLSDTQLGLLQGPAFAVVYALAAIPLGRAVDRWNRRNLIVGGLIVWSVATALCGFAVDFWTLLLARAGVGLGEACLIPAIFSLIPDIFPPERRPTAYAVYMATVVPGVSLSLSLAGSVLSWAEQNASSLPLVGEPWRFAFLAVSAPAPLFVFAFLWLKEPQRIEEASRSPDARLPMMPFIRSNWRLLAAVALGGSMASVAFTAWLQWLPTLLARAYEVPPSTGGIWGGAVAAAASVVGSIVAARLAGRLRRSDPERAEYRAAIAPLMISATLAVAAFAVGSASVLLALMAGQLIGPVVALTLWPVLIAAVTPNRLRGQCTALMKLTEYLLLSISAVTVGALSDSVFRAPESFPNAVFVVVSSATLLSLAAFVTAGRYGAAANRRVAGAGAR